MITGRNIVCVASNWFDHPTSKHHVMRLLARDNHVLWINFHASRRPRLTRGDTGVIFRRLRRAWDGPQRVAPQIDVLSPVLIPLPESRAARFLNGRLLAARIRRALRNLPDRPLQLWLFTPDIPELIARLPAEKVVYYCVDDFAAFDGFNTALVERLEQETMASADAVIATSQKLYAERAGRHPNVQLVPHGVDFDHFAEARSLSAEAIPADMQAIPRPVFGYMGLISEYVDLDLIGRAARRRPDWSFVLLGDTRCGVEPISGLPNVYRLGGKPYSELPAYCRGFDVGLIPFRMNRLVQAVNPIKLREYLAAGLPVVSAPMEAVLRYAPAVQTAETVPEFITACERALALAAEQPPQDRQALVRDESWTSRVAWLSRIVMESTPAALPRHNLVPRAGSTSCTACTCPRTLGG